MGILRILTRPLRRIGGHRRSGPDRSASSTLRPGDRPREMNSYDRYAGELRARTQLPGPRL